MQRAKKFYRAVAVLFLVGLSRTPAWGVTCFCNADTYRTAYRSDGAGDGPGLAYDERVDRLYIAWGPSAYPASGPRPLRNAPREVPEGTSCHSLVAHAHVFETHFMGYRPFWPLRTWEYREVPVSEAYNGNRIRVSCVPINLSAQSQQDRGEGDDQLAAVAPEPHAPRSESRGSRDGHF